MPSLPINLFSQFRARTWGEGEREEVVFNADRIGYRLGTRRSRSSSCQPRCRNASGADESMASSRIYAGIEQAVCLDKKDRLALEHSQWLVAWLQLQIHTP